MTPSRPARLHLAIAAAWLLAGCAPGLPTAMPGPTGARSPASDGPAHLRGPLPYATVGAHLGVWDGQRHRPLFLKGVNLGIGVPGTSPGELAPSRGDYDRWLARMGEIGMNCVRVYTLLPPHFYEAIAAYNAARHDAPLYVMQGVWLEEENPARDLQALTPGFDAAIREVIDCVHGRGDIPTRPGRASGTFRADISPWVIGWLIGREIAPDEVLTTDRVHAGDTTFTGAAFALATGTPSEAWATARLDQVVTYERGRYGVQRPVSMASWPTLDPLRHPTEDPAISQEDAVAIDFAKITTVDAPAGLFASYHAYPYYPDFMTDQADYHRAADAAGPNTYVGYLADLKAHYRSMPLIIAEVGLPSSWGNAHDGSPGLSHGGLSEHEQGQGDARLLHDVYGAGAGGALLFAWIDEWWKRTWIVDELTMPRERYPLWHDLTSPEQNFGLIGFAVPAPRFGDRPPTPADGRVRAIQAAADAAFFSLRITLDAPLTPGDTLTIGFDTYADDRGESVLPGGIRTDRRHELALVYDPPGQAQLHVTEAYDLFGIWHDTPAPGSQFRSTRTDGAPWVPVRWKNRERSVSPDGTRIFPATAQPIGRLRVQVPGEPPTSLDALVIEGATVQVRLPWTLLQFTDPSRRRVMDDDRATPDRETAESEGIAVSVALGQDLLETGRLAWDTWDTAPATTEVEKSSLPLVAEAFHGLPGLLP